MKQRISLLNSRLLCLFSAITITSLFVAFSPTQATASTSSPPTDTSAAIADISHVQQFADSHRQQIGGVYVDRTSREIVVDLAASDSLSMRQIITNFDTAASGYQLRFVKVKYSRAQLDTVMGQIASLQPWASETASTRTLWYADAKSDRVIVGLTKVTVAMAALAKREFGDIVSLTTAQRPEFTYKTLTLPSDRIVTKPADGPKAPSSHPETPAVAPIPSRYLDEPPYYGGDSMYRIVGSSGGTTSVILCTSAFTWTGFSSSLTMSSAGHCGPSGAAWQAGYLANNTLYTTGLLGTSVASTWGNGVPDGQMLSNSNTVNYAAQVYSQTTTTQNIVGEGSPSQGEGVCFDGAMTQANCAASVTAVNTTVAIRDPSTGILYNVPNIDIASSTNGSVIAQPGDSGGPVYQSSVNGVSATGIISAASATGTTGYFTDIVEYAIDYGGNATPTS